jgi:hypothetical protein
MYNNLASVSTIKNSIFWGNTAPSGKSILNNGYSTCTISFSDIENGVADILITVGTAGNIESDPKFLNAADVDGTDNIHRTTDDGLSLTAGSPALVKDAGNTAATLTTDITGAARPGGAGNSMGAYEF